MPSSINSDSPKFASTVTYDQGLSTKTKDDNTQFVQLLLNGAQVGVQAALASAGPIGIGAGALASAAGGSSGSGTLDPQQQAYLKQMQDMQNQGAALQCSMLTLQQRAQNDSVLYQGISNTSKTVHETQINTIRNVRA